MFVLGPSHGDGERLEQPAVAGEAEDVIDPVRLAPRHQRLAGETAVSAKHDPDPRPTRADPCNDPPDFLDDAGRGVDAGAPELRREQVATAEDVKRQVAVAAIVTVEEAAFLMAVQRIVGGVQVKDDLLRRFGMRVEEEVDKEAFDGAPVDGDLALAVVRSPRGVLQPVQRALATQRRAVRTARLQPIGK